MLTLCSDTFARMSCDLTRPGVRRRARRHRRKLADLTCPDAALADPICGVETVGSAGYRKVLARHIPNLTPDTPTAASVPRALTRRATAAAGAPAAQRVTR